MDHRTKSINKTLIKHNIHSPTHNLHQLAAGEHNMISSPLFLAILDTTARDCRLHPWILGGESPLVQLRAWMKFQVGSRPITYSHANGVAHFAQRCPGLSLCCFNAI